MIGLDNRLPPNRRQAIIWTNDDIVYWRWCVTRPQWINNRNGTQIHANYAYPNRMCIIKHFLQSGHMTTNASQITGNWSVFFQHTVPANDKETTKGPHYCPVPLWWEFHWSPVIDGFPHRAPVMRRAFPCGDVITLHTLYITLLPGVSWYESQCPISRNKIVESSSYVHQSSEKCFPTEFETKLYSIWNCRLPSNLRYKPHLNRQYIFFITQMLLEHRLSALLQHLHSRLNIWLQ